MSGFDQTENTSSGGGDVAGPGTAVDGQLAMFDGTSGALLAASGIISTGETLLWPNAAIALGAAAGDNSIRYVDGVGPRFIDNANGGNQWTLNLQGLTANRAQAVPDVNGTLVVITGVVTTVGANGAASALTANPLGYILAALQDGTPVQIPYYSVA